MIAPFIDAPIPDGAVIADVRWYLDGRSGREAHERGHIPGAVFIDLDGALAADPGRDGRHPLPAPGDFAAHMSAAGIAEDDTVVAYDDAGGVIAARLVWMLRALGTDAAVLDGGIDAWEGPLDIGTVEPAHAAFTPRDWPAELLVDIDDVTDAGVLIDARESERYRGELEPVDPRAGHIPGARNLPCRGNLGRDGRLLDPESLRARFDAVGATAGADVVSYCGSGVTACHNLLVLEHIGRGRGRLFPGSWSQWSADDARSAVTGPQPG